MRLMKVVGVSFLILILASFTIPSCQATIEKEYMEYRYYYDWFAFKVKATIQTEKDGTWNLNGSYHIFLFVTLTEINHTRIKSLTIDKASMYPYWSMAHDGEYIGRFYDVGDTGDGVIAIEVEWGVHTGCVDLRPSFQINFTYTHGGYFPYTWESDEPLYIHVTDPATDVVSRMNSIENQLSTITNLMYALIVTTIILIATTGYLAVKKTQSQTVLEKTSENSR